jgi:hypothetical protein
VKIAYVLREGSDWRRQNITHIGHVAVGIVSRPRLDDVEILFLVLVLLVVTRVFAEFAERVGLPALVGDLVAGVALGLILARSYGPLAPLRSACQSDSFTSFIGYTDR